MRIDSYGITDTGRARDTNEDAILVEGDAQMFVVADGVGGMLAGEVASGVAVGVMLSELGPRSPSLWSALRRRRDSTLTELRSAIENAHMQIRQRAEEQGHEGMATTIAALVFREDRVTVAHVGDSRIYRMRDGEFQPLTRDHSALEEFMSAGVPMTEEQKANFPYRNVITRALGFKGDFEVALARDAAIAGDIYLLCSDGLTKHVDDDGIRDVLSRAVSAEAACVTLVENANERGGTDNISVVIVRIVD